MKVSLNIVKQFTEINCSVDELVEKINQQLGGVEEIIDLGVRYKDALIVRVAECDKHPDADKLSVCLVDDGGQNKTVPRDENGLVQIVCGANNVHTGMLAVWLPPLSTVPSSFSEKELFVLDARELRGVLSQGMLASVKELGIGSDHDGILEIDPDEWKPNDVEIKAGASFAKAYGLDDIIIDIENKMFTHRPDLFGQLGVAREISAITKGLPAKNNPTDTWFVNPDWYWSPQDFADSDGVELSVHNDAPEKVQRFMSVAMNNVSIKPSPLWLQCQLTAMGGKPLNNAVDITNYMMLMTAQPAHAYDYDKLRGGVIGTRMASEGEKITLLNGKTYQLNTEDIVIVDGEGPIGLAGIMGGHNSEVSSDTTRIVLEVATFDMYTLRKSSMRHGVFTDALTRFNKGQSQLQTDRILAEIMNMFKQYASATQASQVFDLPHDSDQNKLETLSSELKIETDFINKRLGIDLTTQQIRDLLKRVNFISESPANDENSLLITAPFWRTDIELPEDVVEEVGRLYGFDKLKRELPQRSIKPTYENPVIKIKQKIRQSLSQNGANEVLTYSFVHKNIMEKSEQETDQAFQLSNALSPELQYYRLTVLPSLLDKVHQNIKSGHDEFTIFEIGKGHNKKYHADDDNGLPGEMNFVDAVYASKQPKNGAPYYQVRQLVEQICLDYGFKLRFKSIDEPIEYPVTAPFDLSRSALVETEDGVFIGMVGELKQSVIKNFKLPQYSAAMTLSLDGIVAAISQPRQVYAPLNKYPSAMQDLSLKVSGNTKYSDLFEIARNTVSETNSDYDVKISPVSIYQADNESTKTITFHIEVASSAGTLTATEMTSLVDKIVVNAQRELQASRA